MRVKLLSFVLLLCSLALSAQQSDSVAVVGSVADTVSSDQPRKLGIVRRTVRGFDRLNDDYIEPQHYIFTVMMQGTYAYDRYTLSSSGSERQTVTFAPDMTLRVGPYFGWKWFFGGYTFELGNINFNQIKQEFDLSVYSSQIGIDLFYRRTGSEYKLREASFGKIDGEALNGVPFDGLKAGITGFNVYYIFNHGRFSYPAAFAQSTIQKISCGSWMAGVGYTHNSVELDYERLQRVIDEQLGKAEVRLDSGLMFHSMRYNDINVSAGYAYNWVFCKNWLLAASLQAALAYKRSSGDVSGDSHKSFSFQDINIDGIGRFGLVYNCMKWYAGASVILHSNNYRKPRFSTNNTFGSMNVYVGFNFVKKNKYKKQEE